jgi:single-stranded-DNA-specific exonuclease
VVAEGRKPVICVASESWSPGVVGIVAGRLVSEFGVPAFVFGRDGDRFVGSGRSIPEFNVIDAMASASGLILRYGGHPQACGLTIEGADNYVAFKSALEAYAAEKLDGLDLRPALEIDAVIGLGEADWGLVDWLARFEPYGEANPRPRFLIRNLLVSSAEIIGKNRNTLRLGLRGDGPREYKVIGFGFGSRAGEFATGSRADVVLEIGVNSWNGTREIQLKLVDARAAGEFA